MAGKRNPPDDPKAAALRSAGAMHPNPESVQDETFNKDAFFDRRDRVQVKYEMLRRHIIDGQPVTDVANSFGVSRQTFYKNHSAFETQGLVGLLPRPHGPQRAHKCTDEILDYVEQWQAQPHPDKTVSMADAVESRFAVRIHPRSLLRALARREKKRRRTRKKSSS
jgi:transposase